jgi:hypothetical protein
VAVEKELTAAAVMGMVVAEKAVGEKAVAVAMVKVVEVKELRGVVEHTALLVAAKVVEDTALLVAAKVVEGTALLVVDFWEEMILVLEQMGCLGKERLEKAIGHRFQRGIDIMGHSFLFFCFCFY